MKKIIVTLVGMLIASLAFGQTSSSNNNQGTTTTERVRVTGTPAKMTSEEGAAANYQPLKTLVVRQDGSSKPGRYVLDGRGHVWDKAGQVVQSAIKPGTRVRVYYANMGDFRVIDHVMIAD